MNVLIADDDATFRLVLGGTLEQLGHVVTATETGLQAWAAFQEAYYPVLITDWLMPEIDGLTLTKMVRARPHAQYTYVVLLTGKGGKESYREAMRSGVDDFMAKPPDEDELTARLLVAERIVGMQAHVRQLESLMTVCAYCKKVRQPQTDQWVGMEEYVATQLGTLSSHTICPSCYVSQVLPELERLGIKR